MFTSSTLSYPVACRALLKFNLVLLNTEPGDSVVFNDNLIHGGAINKGLKCRVSVEFTMLIKEIK